MPEITPVTDSTIAPLINGATTGAAIDARINTQVAPQVQKITADFIAGDRAVVDAAAAAVDANPKVADLSSSVEALEGSRWLKPVKLTTTSNIDTLPAGAYYPNATATATAIGLPTTNFGVLQVYDPTTAGTVQTWTPVSGTIQVWQRTRVGTSWSAWTRTDAGSIVIPPAVPAWWKGAAGLAAGSDIGALEQGVYRVATTTIGATLDLPSPNQGMLEVFNAGASTNGNFQRWTTAVAVPQMWIRTRTGANGTWAPWLRIDAGAVTAPAPATTAPSGMEREMRLSAFKARRGTVGTGGLPAVALVFDHGTNFFASKVLPLLREFGLPATLGLNSQMLDPTFKFNAHDNLTSWADVQSWALNDGIEIWNHGRFHAPGSTDAATVTEIVGGRQELEALLPKIPIEGWLHTGEYGGFKSGSSPDAYWTYPVGGIILNSHAIATGNIQGSQPLTGVPVPGRDGLFLDASTTPAKNAIIAAQKQGAGFMVRHHPQFLDTEGYITTADLRTFLSWVASERDAGRLMVLTGGGLALADSSTSVRDRLDDPDAWVSNRQVISLANCPRVRGSVREFTVKGSSAGTVTLTIADNAGSLNATRNVALSNTGVARLQFTIPLDATTLTFGATATAGTLIEHSVRVI